jgi:hypothetical protein
MIKQLGSMLTGPFQPIYDRDNIAPQIDSPPVSDSWAEATITIMCGLNERAMIGL